MYINGVAHGGMQNDFRLQRATRSSYSLIQRVLSRDYVLERTVDKFQT
jgi:hypothetical protein